MDQTVIAGRTGMFYISLAPLQIGISALDENSDYRQHLVANASFYYSIRTSTAGCYYYDEKSQAMSSEGCLV